MIKDRKISEDAKSVMHANYLAKECRIVGAKTQLA